MKKPNMKAKIMAGVMAAIMIFVTLSSAIMILIAK